MNKLSQLFTYVCAIHQKPGAAVISSQCVDYASWQDQGFEVRQEVKTYYFDNGVIIRRTLEQDAFPDDLACAECWITYEVLSGGTDLLHVEPSRQVFDSVCRESFWLAYHGARAEGAN